MDVVLSSGSARHRSSRSLPRVRVLGAAVLISLFAIIAIVVSSHPSGGPLLGPVPVEPSGSLPIDPPTPLQLQSSTKKVFAHYMTSFPVSIDNEPPATDYYASQYLLASGEGGKFASTGGFVRERPLTRRASAASTWQLDDMKVEVQRAISAGIGGFSVDLLSLNGAHWSSLERMLTAAHAVDPTFSILLMPDAATDVVDDPQALAAKIASVASNPATYHLADGRLVVAPFYAENKSAAWWQSWISVMKSTYRIDVAFVPTFLDYGNAAAFSSFSYGYSTWGDRSPNSIGDSASQARDAHAHGKIWMQPIAVQDVRPTGGIYAEADNTETLRSLWKIAIDTNAEWVQLVTWNDYSEGTEFAPSSHIGWGPLDISTYYISWFRTGAQPTLVGDALFVSHRIQPWAALPTGPQTELMELVPSSSPPRDTVEALTFLTASQRVDVRVGGVTYTYQAPAGVFAKTYPLAQGTVSASIVYVNGATLAVTSPSTVVARPAVQDLQYHFAASTRDGVLTGVPPLEAPAPATTTPATTTPATTTPATSATVTSVPPPIVPATAPFSWVAVADPPVAAWMRKA